MISLRRKDVAKLRLTFFGLVVADSFSSAVDVNGLVDVVGGANLGRNEQNKHSPTLSVDGCFMANMSRLSAPQQARRHVEVMVTLTAHVRELTLDSWRSDGIREMWA